VSEFYAQLKVRSEFSHILGGEWTAHHRECRKRVSPALIRDLNVRLCGIMAQHRPDNLKALAVNIALAVTLIGSLALIVWGGLPVPASTT